MSRGEIIYQGWLRKSPPEKKLKRYTWKKRWFVLRSGRMSGDSDVLEYYKKDHSKKPIRVIDLHYCQQVDAGLTFNRKEFQDSFVFDVRTSDRTFYLVAETEVEMNQWVHSICQLCGFNQAEGNHAASATLTQCPMGEELSRLTNPLTSLHDLDASQWHGHRALSNRVSQDYLLLHQCMSRRTESIRSASFSHATRTSQMMGGDTDEHSLPLRFSHCFNGMGAQLHGFYSMPKLANSQLSNGADWLMDACCGLTKAPYSQQRCTVSEPGMEGEEYIFKTPRNMLAGPASSSHQLDNHRLTEQPECLQQIPFNFDRNHNTLAPSSGESSDAPPPRPPKPGNSIARRNTLPAMENYRVHHELSLETDHLQACLTLNPSGNSTDSVCDGVKTHLRGAAPLTHSDSEDSEENYVPMNPGLSSSPSHGFGMTDNPQCNYIPMSPGPRHLHPPGVSAALPIARFTPPPINRNLKPDRRPKPTALDLHIRGIIDELPFQSPITMTWTRPMVVPKSLSSQHCAPISTQSITSTDSGDSEERYMVMQNPTSTSPVASGGSSPAHRRSRDVDYLDLDFYPGTPSNQRKLSTSSLTADDKVDYVQVDQEKTQALQNTMQEWTDARQSTEPAKGFKS